MEKHSFTRHEHEILPNFRQRINKAESTEDVKKFFVYTVKKLCENIFEGEMDFRYEDFKLTWHKEPYYTLSDRLHSLEIFNNVWNGSDLPRVIKRLADSAVRRYKHLEKSPEKTEAKIRR